MSFDTNRETTPTYTSQDFLAAASHVEALKREQCHRALFNARRKYAGALRQMAACPNARESVMVIEGVALYDYTKWFKSDISHLQAAR